MAKVYRDTRRRKKGDFRPWVVAYVGLDGRRHRERTQATTKNEAEAILRAMLSEITKANIAGVQSVEAVKPKLFREFLEQEYLPHCQATHTSSSYQRDLTSSRAVLPTFGRMPLASITPGDVQRYVDKRVGQMTRRKTPVRPATVNRELISVSGALSEAVRRGYIDRNPASFIRQLPEHNDRLRFLSEDEEAAIMAKCPKHVRPIVQMGLHTGMRLGEIRLLQWADVDLKRGLIAVVHSKNHKTRHVPINHTLMKILRSIQRVEVQIDESRDDVKGLSPFVFVNPLTGRPYKDVSHAFKRACKAAGVADVNFHTTRHTAASRMAQLGIPLNTIREILGHGSMQMTLRYAHLSPNNLRDAVTALERAEDRAANGTSTVQKPASHTASMQPLGG